jgi:CelD/BcsL family acetyltransferase involved in cellulose biosynthesis
MQIVFVDAVQDPRWQRLQALRDTSLFHSSPWLGSLAAAYGFRPQACLLLHRGEAIAGLPVCRVSDFSGERVVASPFSDYCDPIVASPQEWTSLFTELCALGVPMTFRWRDHGTDNSCLRVVRRARWHGVTVDGGLDAAWTRLVPAARRAVRKSLRERVEIRLLEDDQLDEFVRLHVALRKRKYRLLAQPAAFFVAIRDRFKDIGGWFPLAAVHDDRVVAVTVYLKWKDQLFYKFNASAAEALPLRPNDALMWEGIRLAHELGCTRLDLGASDDTQPGLIRFKRNYGAEEREIRDYYYDPTSQRVPGSHRAWLGQASQLLTSPFVPDHLTRRAGALLYRYFV